MRQGQLLFFSYGVISGVFKTVQINFSFLQDECKRTYTDNNVTISFRKTLSLLIGTDTVFIISRNCIYTKQCVYVGNMLLSLKLKKKN